MASIKKFIFFVAGSTREESKVTGWKATIAKFFENINPVLADRGISLSFYDADSVSNELDDETKQDRINSLIDKSDFFYALVDDVVGPITAKEFERAYNRSIEENKPKVFVYFYSTESFVRQTPLFQDKESHTGDLCRDSSQVFSSAIDTLREAAENLNYTLICFTGMNQEGSYVNFWDNRPELNTVRSRLEELSACLMRANNSARYLYDYVEANQFENHFESGPCQRIQIPEYYPQQNIDFSVQVFKERIRSLGNYSIRFHHIDTVKLDMLTELEKCLPAVKSPAVQFRGGKVILNGEKLESDALNLMNVPLYKNYPGCERLAKAVASSKNHDGENTPETAAVEKQWNDLENKIKDFCSLVYVAKRQPERMSQRTRKAIQAIEAGNYSEAQKELEDESNRLAQDACQSEEGRYTLELYDLIRQAVNENADAVKEGFGKADAQQHNFPRTPSKSKRIFDIAVLIPIICIISFGVAVGIRAGILEEEIRIWAFSSAFILQGVLMSIIYIFLSYWRQSL
ncbi:MAG: hypothetical protein IJT94_06400 [Oscillibacter sp.]|nr:hypothetical protein [Oscillibacter sp.]